MENLQQIISSLPEIEPAADLHQRIMRSLFYLKLRRWIGLACIIASLHFIYSSWLFSMKLWENNVDAIVKMLFNDFEANLDYLQYMKDVLVNAMPLRSLIIFLVSLIVTITSLIFFNSLSKQLNKGRKFLFIIH